MNMHSGEYSCFVTRIPLQGLPGQRVPLGVPIGRPLSQRDVRQRHIRELLRTTAVHSQGELQERLAEIGVKAEQATLSRDLHALGVVKGPDGYLLPDAPMTPAPARGELVQLVQQYLVAVDCAGQLVVLRTGPGRAQPLGLALDNARLSGALGTIAGDDTIFVAMSTVAAAERLADAIRAIGDGAGADALVHELDADLQHDRGGYRG